jgi:hypothetical protein
LIDIVGLKERGVRKKASKPKMLENPCLIDIVGLKVKERRIRRIKGRRRVQRKHWRENV